MDYRRVLLPMEPRQTELHVRVATHIVRVRPVSSVITKHLVDRAVNLTRGNLGTRPWRKQHAKALVDEKSLWTKQHAKQQQDTWG